MIKDFCSIEELLSALLDCIKAHQSLIRQVKILRRDISENDLINTDPTASSSAGRLTDLDMATVDGERTGGQSRTGIMSFMAIGVLRGVDHTYRHDLKSFFYVLLGICAHHSWKREYRCKLRDKPEYSLSKRWYVSDMRQISQNKEYDTGFKGFNAVLEKFRPSFKLVKPLCGKLRIILLPLTRDGALDLTTPADSEKV